MSCGWMVKNLPASLTHYARLSILDISHLLEDLPAICVMPSILVDPLSLPLVCLKPPRHKFFAYIVSVQQEFVNTVRSDPREVLGC